jgi:hypothetical protein
MIYGKVHLLIRLVWDFWQLAAINNRRRMLIYSTAYLHGIYWKACEALQIEMGMAL